MTVVPLFPVVPRQMVPAAALTGGILLPRPQLICAVPELPVRCLAPAPGAGPVQAVVAAVLPAVRLTGVMLFGK